MNAVFFLLFSWGMVRARSHRQVLALALVGVTGAAVVAQPSITYAQGMIGAITSILNLINGEHSHGTEWNQLRTDRHEQPLPGRGLSNPAYQPGPGAGDWNHQPISKSHAQHFQYQPHERDAARDPGA